ncbi:phytanoyl-CoA dioxygenase family protein [Actinokineospora sp. G85]|uniref:phytanoyl-CoA dioxygenase family protein n=1 Tax=Actinokineospora sp. G85 TaxID=3406626 RepID=UPI003C721B9C
MTNVDTVRRLKFGRVREVAGILGQTVAYDLDKVRRYRRPVEAPLEARAYSQALRRDGYALIPGYRSARQCAEWAERIMAAIPAPPDPGADSGDDYRVYSGSRTAELPSGGVVEWRNADGADGKDKGITCFYHVDREFPEFAELRSDPLVSAIISGACGRELPSRAFKCFINESTGQTSDYHVDQTAQDQFKTFLFLTDVTDQADGAHSYVPGTHLPTVDRYLNYGWNMVDSNRYEFDMTLMPTRRPVDLLCPAGTLAIVDITGAHRALPQAEGRRRIVLNNCFDDFTYD